MSRGVTILPRQDAREAALFFLVSALCFLAALSGLGARAALAAADDWAGRVSGQATVRIDGDDAAAARVLALTVETPGVVSARLLSRGERLALLEPWLGAATLPDDLPLPQLIAVETDPATPQAGALLQTALTGTGARIDTHAEWTSGLRRATQSVATGALAVLAILAAAAACSVAFATHAALLARRDTVEVLHLSGARDAFIARLFEERFLMLGVKAGVVGAVLALAAAAFLLYAVKQSGDRIWLLPTMSLSLADGMILGLTPLVAGGTAMLAARLTVLRSLAELY